MAKLAWSAETRSAASNNQQQDIIALYYPPEYLYDLMRLDMERRQLLSASGSVSSPILVGVMSGSVSSY